MYRQIAREKYIDGYLDRQKYIDVQIERNIKMDRQIDRLDEYGLYKIKM